MTAVVPLYLNIPARPKIECKRTNNNPKHEFINTPQCLGTKRHTRHQINRPQQAIIYHQRQHNQQPCICHTALFQPANSPEKQGQRQSTGPNTGNHVIDPNRRAPSRPAPTATVHTGHTAHAAGIANTAATNTINADKTDFSF